MAQRTIKELACIGHELHGATVTVPGLTLKEDCPDLRNSKVAKILRELRDFEVHLQVSDPLADPAKAEGEYGVRLVPFAELQPADALIAAVAHAQYRKLDAALEAACKRSARGDSGCLVFPACILCGALRAYRGRRPLPQNNGIALFV